MKPNKLHRLTLYLITLIIFACFLNVLSHGFVWDDTPNLVENPHYRGLSGPHLSWMFKTFHDANYHPLVWLSLGLDYALWGMNPAGYHLTNLIWHIINSVLFFYLIALFLNTGHFSKTSSQDNAISVCAATGTLFFAIHPLRVENVAWLSARADLMCTAFYLLTVMCYFKYVKSIRHKRKWYICTISFFVFSLLSRAWGITLPAILLIIDGYPLRRLNCREIFSRSNALIILEKIPFIIFSIDAGWLAYLAKSRMAVMLNLDQHDWLDRLMQSAYGLIFYLWKTLIPIRLSPLYLLDKHFNPFETQYVISALLVMAIIIIIYIMRNKFPGLAVCFLCYAFAVSPVLGVVQAGPQIAADRYAYISCLPFGILVGTGTCRLGSILKKKSYYVIVTVILIAAVLSIFTTLFFLSSRQARIWHDNNLLWTHAISVNRDNHVAYWNRGLLFDSQKNFEGALKDYSNAIRCNPTDDKYYNNRGAIRKMRGDIQGALEDFNNAIKINPKSPEPYANRATIYASQNKMELAVSDYIKALEISPLSWEKRKIVKILLDQITTPQKSKNK